MYPNKVISLGGGFYGRVFLAELEKEPYSIIIKIHLYPNLAYKEALQLTTLAAHATVKMPEVYFVHNSDDDTPYDALAMEYITGINAGSRELIINDKDKTNIATGIVDNLISYHQTINPNGFGEIDASCFELDWRDYYKPKAEKILHKAQQTYESGSITAEVFSVMYKAFINYDRIFYLPITCPRLIHGDYNTWNVLIDEDLRNVKAVIDPFNCCWGDSEMDLYQLNNANGKYYGLFDIYRSKFPLSENYEIKKCFYEVFTELMHFYDANIDIGKSNIPAQAKKLETQMNLYGL